ncbi:MAG: PRC-barrel domain-containing protein [Janthinobacterium lividum]
MTRLHAPFWTAALFLTCIVHARADDPAPAAPVPPPANQEIIYKGEATRILGRSVRDPDNNQVGRIVDVLVDDQGVPRAALIDFGGYMGVGNRRIAVAWRALHFLPAAEHFQIRIDMTADQIKETPDFKPAPRADAPPVTMAAPPPPAGVPALGK